MIVTAYAKINFGLHILGKRPDGYHDIETIFLRVNISDSISFENADRLSLECNNRALPVDSTNLCMRAGALLQEQYRIDRGARMVLRKHIPVGAGLGGGSSDAAATLLGLAALWKLPADYRMLVRLAARLGADVPYFLLPETAYATGRGEILEAIDFRLPYWIIVVYPQIVISSAWAYQNLHLSSTLLPRTDLKQVAFQGLDDAEILRRSLRNDFEPVIFEHYPVVREVRDTLLQRGAVFSRLSGSGSAVYGLFRNQPDMEQISRSFPAQNKIFLTPPNFQPNE